MSRRKGEFQKHTMNLRPGDWDYITDIWGAHGFPTSFIVRNLISNYVDKMKAREAEHGDEMKLDLETEIKL